MFYRGYPVVWIMIKYSDGPPIFLPNCVNHSLSPSSVGWYPRIKSAVREQISNVRINTEVLLMYNLFYLEDSLVIMWNNLLCLPGTSLPIRHCSHKFFSTYKIRQHFGAGIIFFNFSTPCVWNVNNTGTKYVRIMKQTAFWRGKKRRVYTMLKIFSTYICWINM
jgi:hypothetical protein